MTLPQKLGLSPSRCCAPTLGPFEPVCVRDHAHAFASHVPSYLLGGRNRAERLPEQRHEPPRKSARPDGCVAISSGELAARCRACGDGGERREKGRAIQVRNDPLPDPECRSVNRARRQPDTGRGCRARNQRAQNAPPARRASELRLGEPYMPVSPGDRPHRRRKFVHPPRARIESRSENDKLARDAPA